MDRNEAEVEQEIQDKGLNAPRLTSDAIDNTIVGSDYHVFPGTTVVCLQLRNGFTVIGESACVDPANFNEDLSRKIAYNNARNKIWQLEGYLLRQFLSEKEAISRG
jgi:hypothetical protein